MMTRGITYLESLIVVAIVALLASAVVLPAYRSYAAARAPADAAATLAEDIALLERTAQNGVRNEGSSLVVVSADPFVYRCYKGRPASVDPNSRLGPLLVERRFPGVVLSGGPIGISTPLLFASNGSAQYESGGIIADQHATIEFSFAKPSGGSDTTLRLNLMTGAVSL